MGFDIGDLVWAKMKSFPPWPAQIVEPNTLASPPKSKKVHQYVKFFGTHDFAWIPDENISPHNESVFDHLIKKKSKPYQRAIDELMNAQKEISPIVNEKVENGKTSTTKVVKILHSAPKKRERNVLVQQSVMKVSKKRRIDNDVNGDEREERDSPRESPPKSDKVDNSVKSKHSTKRKKLSDSTRYSDEREPSSDERDEPGSSRQSVEREDEALKNLPSCSRRRHSIERNQILDNQHQLETEDTNDATVRPAENYEKFGFIGLNELGRPILEKFLQSGMEVILWEKEVEEITDLSEIDKNKLASSPAQLVVDCDVVFCCYDPNTETFNKIVFDDDGILKGFEEAEKLRRIHKGYVKLTSIDFETSKKINDCISVNNGFYLEAPIIGPSENAIDAKLCILASGNRQLFVDCEKCFRVISSNSTFVDCEIGVSSRMSVILNTVSATVLALMSEAMVLADRLGLYKSDVFQVVPLMLENDEIIHKAERMNSPHSKPSTPLKHVSKDMNLSLNIANSVSQKMSITSAANEVYKRARQKYSDCDVTAVHKIIKY